METLTLNNIKKPRLNRIKILVIEDDPETAEVVRILLSMNGYQLIIESESLDILGLLEYTRPDLVIIDYLLPFINGGELCASIKNDNDWKHLPVIIYSAYSRVINSLGNYHCDAFLPKPFDLNELLSLVKTHLFKYEMLSHN